MEPSPHRSQQIVAILILLAIAVGTYWPVLRNDFVDFDDQTEIYQNPDFNPVTLHGLAWNWRHTRMTLYMPLTYTTWGAVADVAPRDDRGVLEAWPFHLLNLGLHAACVVLMFLLLQHLGTATTPAAVGAIAFAIHPIQTEAVAWASGMYTLLGAALSLSALLLYVMAGRDCGARWAWLYGGATLLYIAA